MIEFIRKYKFHIFLWVSILAYICYFSWLTILRYQTLYASYFDLGIMHQTVFNTYRAITNLDPSRILEMTNPFGADQIKRMAIHNDILLAFLAPFYFINNSPVTLVVLQTIVLALGALAIFNISQVVFKKFSYKDIYSLLFALCYLLYPSMQRANIFDFHAVTFAATSLLFMFYFWLTKKYRWSFIFFILSLIAKEQVALTTFFFALFLWFFDKKSKRYAVAIGAISVAWFVFSLLFIIPYFRGGHHFALKYYGDLNVFTVFRNEVWRYSYILLGSVGFLPLLAPHMLAIALPEFAINIFSNSPNMLRIIYHYTAVLQPFIFISAIYGARRIAKFKYLPHYLFCMTLIFAYFYGPLPFTRGANIHPFKYPQKERLDALLWSEKLKNEDFKISSTGQLSPLFTSRRYFYTFSKYYPNADYVVVRLNEIYNYPEKDELIPVYEKLQKDKRFELIYKKPNFEVYKKL